MSVDIEMNIYEFMILLIYIYYIINVLYGIINDVE